MPTIDICPLSWNFTEILVLSNETQMSGCSDYKVEKDRFSVTLFLLDGSMREGYVYLSLHAANHDGPEMVRDVLNQGEPFIPIEVEEGSTRLINKNQIVMVSFPAEERETGSLSFKDLSIHNVTIHLINHGHLEGRVISLLPVHSRRVKDYLNQGEAFLELGRDGTVYLINKKHILFAEEK